MKLQRPIAGILCLSCIASLPGCAIQQAEQATRGRNALVGLSQNDVRMCAGLPNGSVSDKNGDIWMYEHGATPPGGIVPPTLVAPWGGGLQLSPGGGGYCRVQLRFVKGRVTEVSYAGATDITGARDAACAPMIRTCLDRVAQHVDGSSN